MKFIDFLEYIKNKGLIITDKNEDLCNYEIQFSDEKGNLIKPVYIRFGFKLIQIFFEKENEKKLCKKVKKEILIITPKEE